MALATRFSRRPSGSRRLLAGSVWLCTSLDALLTAPLGPRQRAGTLAGVLLRPRSSNYRRLSALSSLLDRLTFGRLSRRLSSSLLDLRHFPLRAQRVTPLAHGTGSTVFLLETGTNRAVLKVLRRSLCRPAREAMQIAAQFQQQHERLRQCYAGVDRLVVPSAFLVLHSPLMGAAAAGVVQPYVPGKKHDIFLDYTVHEAVELLGHHPALREQWLGFSRCFLESMQTGACFDLVGRENLMLVEHEGAMALKIADNGMFDLETLRTRSPERLARLQSHVQRLKEIARTLEPCG
ncbi:MAG: hypothetical protein EHM24_00665 [Acidobacteria bacterium]|nr:MAG: hypothetical protein EHM24_00665 [Acidobacteriota bacterium]